VADDQMEAFAPVVERLCAASTYEQ